MKKFNFRHDDYSESLGIALNGVVEEAAVRCRDGSIQLVGKKPLPQVAISVSVADARELWQELTKLFETGG